MFPTCDSERISGMDDNPSWDDYGYLSCDVLQPYIQILDTNRFL
ncbi:hypothetical protein AM1_2064 [Acaryochloris marina MBIC11017]|uniref:Uncharacterized protein n=1 Tax=Acaryochloris marina (strain MBIC 11017) TaxID=329726 RepID=B0BYR3_ACAM1|nr:hypothetical protein AM1_2064 [Acaryochloris marina MBIC11017]